MSIKVFKSIHFTLSLIHIYTCNCGSVDCRKVITGNDWKKPEVQLINNGWFAKYLEEKIDQKDTGDKKIVLVIGASGGIGSVSYTHLDVYKRQV